MVEPTSCPIVKTARRKRSGKLYAGKPCGAKKRGKVLAHVK